MRDKRPTRLKIHQAALDLFVSQGISETSVRDMAQAAGIAEGTLYRHYPSKDALIADLFLIHYRAFAEQINQRQAALPETAPFSRRLGDLFDHVFTFHDQNPTLFRFLLLVQHHALPRMEDGPDNPVTVLHHMLQQAIEDGTLPRQDPALLGTIVLGMLLQPATAVVYGRLHAPLRPLAKPMAAACYRALTPPPNTIPCPPPTRATGPEHHD
jgi:AcrR family transcriptional regulator